MNIRHHVELSEAERCELTALMGAGRHCVRKFKRAQILLAADSGLRDDDIAAAVAVGGLSSCFVEIRFETLKAVNSRKFACLFRHELPSC